MATLNVIADEIIGALDRPFDDQFKARVKSAFRHEAATIVRQAIDKDGLTDHFKTRFNVAISVVDDSSLICGSACGSIRSTNSIAPPTRYKTDDPFSFVGNADGTVVYIYTNLTELPYADLTEVYDNNPIRYVYDNGYIYVKMGGPCGTIESIVDYDATVTGTILITSSGHNLRTSDDIIISGTVDYDGDYSITKVDADTFYVTIAHVTDEVSGTWKRDVEDDCLSIEGSYPLGEVFDKTNENRLNDNIFNDDTELPLPEDLIQAIKLKLLDGELSIIDSNDKIQNTHSDNE